MKSVVFTVLILGALAASAFAAQPLGVVYAKDYGVKCDGKTDDTAAIRATATAAGQGAHIQLPSGICLVTDTITISNSLQHWSGAGMRATIIDFEPTGNKTAFLVQAPAAKMYWQGSLRDLSFSSADSSYAKVAIEIVDASDFVVENVSISGTVVVGGTYYWSGAGSIGIRTRGREFGLFRNISIASDRPLVISDNPNSPLDLDHHHFHDSYLIANGNPVVEIQSGVNVTNLTFDGLQAWVKGTYGLKWIDTATSMTGMNLRLENVRWEQAEGAGGYFVDIEHNHALYNLLLQNCYESVEANGVRLRKVRTTTFQNVYYPNITGGTALDVDATVFPIMLDSSFFQVRTVLQTPGLTKVFDSGQSSLSGTVNPLVIYDNPGGASVPTFYKLGISGLPNSNPGKGSKQLWYDPADGNRVKFAE